MRTDLQIRVQAFNATRDHFKDRPFKWGSVDCLKVARYHALQMGHKPPRPPRYSSMVGAVRSLKKMNVETCEDLLANYFPRIPVASSVVGDLLIVPGENNLDAILISGGRWVLGFHEESNVLEFILPENIKSAYRL